MFYYNNSKKGEKHSRIERYNILRLFAADTEYICGHEMFDGELLDELMTYDIYIRENIKTRPSFARETQSGRETIKQIMSKYGIEKTNHVEEFSAKALENIFGHKADGRFVLFDYTMRNPVDYNAEIKCIDF